MAVSFLLIVLYVGGFFPVGRCGSRLYVSAAIPLSALGEAEATCMCVLLSFFERALEGVRDLRSTLDGYVTNFLVFT